MVHRLQRGRTLERMANRRVQRTPAHGTAGPVRVVAAIHRLAPTYPMSWDVSLAQALAAQLSPAEMASLARQGEASPCATTMRAPWPAIEKDAHADALPRMRALVTAALQHAAR